MCAWGYSHLGGQFNQTHMILKFVHDDAQNWEMSIESMLFAVKEAPQVSPFGLSPFKLLYRLKPCGALDVVREYWEERLVKAKFNTFLT